MQKVNILGLELNDHTKRETLEMEQWFLYNGTLDIILYIDHSVLTEAGKDEELSRWIEAAGLTQWASLDILEAAGVTGSGRYREVENRESLRELLYIAESDHKTVFLISDSEEQIEYMRKTLRQIQPDLMIAGSLIAGTEDEEIKTDINEINTVAPAIIIARMDFRKQLTWLRESNNMVNAAIWLGIPSDMPLVIKKEKIFSKIRRSCVKLFFSRKVHKYSNKKTE